jgi:hypothetical protein
MGSRCLLLLPLVAAGVPLSRSCRTYPGAPGGGRRARGWLGSDLPGPSCLWSAFLGGHPRLLSHEILLAASRSRVRIRIRQDTKCQNQKSWYMVLEPLLGWERRAQSKGRMLCLGGCAGAVPCIAKKTHGNTICFARMGVATCVASHMNTIPVEKLTLAPCPALSKFRQRHTRQYNLFTCL